MSYLTESQVREAAMEAMGTSILRKSTKVILEEARVAQAARSSFDVFLSHSIRDEDIVIGTKRLIERSGRTVYVDWIVDPSLDRSKVTGRTAETLRTRMRQCTSLLYLYSRHSQASRWMPWELGYFDGHNGNVAVLPILPDQGKLDFDKEEYLQIYPKADFTGLGSAQPSMWVNKAKGVEIASSHLGLEAWSKGTDKLRPVI